MLQHFKFVTHNSQFTIRHLPSLLLILLASVPTITDELSIRLRRLALLPLIRWLPPARLCLTLPLAVILNLLLKPL